MKKNIYLLLTCIISLTACTSNYEKGGNGYEYRVISNGRGKTTAFGNYIQFHLRQFYKDKKKDTLLGDTREAMPRIDALDSTMPAPYLKAFINTAIGDSVVIRISTDSAYNSSNVNIPAYMSKGGYVYTTVKIINIFSDRTQVDSANRAELKLNGLKIYKKQLADFEKTIEKDKSQIELDAKAIAARLDEQRLRYSRGKWGTFIVIRDTGSGDKIAYNDVIGVNYTGKTMNGGKIFDSNIDPKFDHLGTYEVSMRQLGEVIPGWTDALLQLKSGSKATIYIPSSLAYGKKGKPGRIPPDENVIFDIEVIKVISEDEALQIVSENRRRASELVRKIADSLKAKH